MDLEVPHVNAIILTFMASKTMVNRCGSGIWAKKSSFVLRLKFRNADQATDATNYHDE
jgi:hypothetical protein